MSTKTQHTPKIENLRMPSCSYGFRSGFATATVDGQPRKLHTSRSAHFDYYEHCEEVRALFAEGKGEPENEELAKSCLSDAAPDLLAACKDLVARLKHHDYTHEGCSICADVRAARQAIARAEGEGA